MASDAAVTGSAMGATRPRRLENQPLTTPRELDARILRHESVGPQRFRMLLHAPYVAEHAVPGQFVQLLYRDSYGPSMRRPFSILRVHPDSGAFDVLYVTRGAFTRGLARLPEGASVSIVGPLGNGFDLSAAYDRNVVLVAGGVGAPPLCFMATALLRHCAATQIAVVNGARTRDLLVAQEDFEALGVHTLVATEDGSAGRMGTALDALRDLLPGRPRPVVYACGPTPMLRAVADHCVSSGVPCQVSLETMMACGVGVCMGCVVKVRDGSNDAGYLYARTCWDGPAFWAEDLVWD